MTTCLRKCCSFGLRWIFCAGVCHCECSSLPFGFEDGMWDMVVFVLDHSHCICFSLYVCIINQNSFKAVQINKNLVNAPHKDRFYGALWRRWRGLGWRRGWWFVKLGY